MSRSTRRSQPEFEGLEGRKLLSGSTAHDQALRQQILERQAVAVAVTDSGKLLQYIAPQGGRVSIRLYGSGTLAASTTTTDGSLNLIYSGTLVSSKIVGSVVGGSGFAPLASIRDAAVPPRSASTLGAEPLNVVQLRRFNLIDGGYINLSGGLNFLYLASAGRDTQIHLRDNANNSTNSTESAIATAVTTNTAASITNGGAVSNAPVVGGNTNGAVIVGGTTTTVAAPTGVAVFIPHVNAGPLGTPPVGPPQVYGLDAAAGQLLRFNATTGAVTQSIPVPGLASPIAGVGLGRDHTRLVALVGDAQTVRAYDVEGGALVGQFTTANLAAEGLKAIDGIGSTDTRTVLTDGTHNIGQILNITASLDSGQAVPIGAPILPVRELRIGGGATGLAGSETLYIAGAAHFDTFQPDQLQLGVATFARNALTGQYTETARLAVPSATSPYTDVPGTVIDAALGSVDGDLALRTGLANGQNIFTLFNPRTNAIDGRLGLNAADPLAGLSESFHPELLNAALIDVRGNLKSFTGTQATGLIINDEGTLNVVSIKEAVDTTVIGAPLNHVAIPRRQNVQLLSTARGVFGGYSRGGVQVLPLRSVGPLTLP